MPPLSSTDIERMRTLLYGAAQGPFDWSASGKPGGNGDFNIYVTDRDGRKVMAVWGKRGEKEATADLVMMLLNFAAELIEAASGQANLRELMKSFFDPESVHALFTIGDSDATAS